MILTFDPGDERVGFVMAKHLPEQRKVDIQICRIVPAGEVYSMLELAEKLLQPNQTHTFVIENFRNDQLVRDGVGSRNGKHRNNAATMFQWSEMKTSRMIGALEYAAFRMNKSPVILQEPGVVLGQAKRWAPFHWPKGHLPDDKSAYCHLAYYAMKSGFIDTTDDILEKGQEKLW